jgi:hypothetical protein
MLSARLLRYRSRKGVPLKVRRLAAARLGGSGCGGCGRLLKLLICRVAGIRAEGYLPFAGWYPQDFVRACIQADRRGHRKCVQMRGRG